jgi:small subunit ribosomal protein S8
VIKPRYSIKCTELHEWESRFLPAQDFGVFILTTTEGVVSHLKAKELGVGGKLLAYVY